MTSFSSTTIRIGSVVASTTLIILASGCHSTSVTSRSAINPGPGSVPSAPYFRSYEPPTRPYEDNSLPVPVPVPPAPPSEVPPVPGYSDSDAPETPPLPKRRRPWVPATTRSQPANAQNSVVDQTAANTLERRNRVKSEKSTHSAAVGRNSIPPLNDLPVPLRSSKSVGVQPNLLPTD